ncbi:MAG: YceI family protein [Elusimicrobia bacterium]|nr:YceI family protein [Elusimicrobiota bacterium]
MKKLNFRLLAALPCLLLALTTTGRAQTTLTPRGSLWIEGDSTLHRWSSTSTAVEMSVASPGSGEDLAAAVKAGKFAGLVVHIPDASLKSGESGLDKNMRVAMKAAEFPEVSYRLDRYELGKSAADGATPIHAAGELTIAGRTRAVSIDARLAFSADGLHLVGSYPLNMSDYGIKPPTLMFGAIKVKDPVVVRFDLLLASNREKTK